jgi:hypothetical protein
VYELIIREIYTIQSDELFNYDCYRESYFLIKLQEKKCDAQLGIEHVGRDLCMYVHMYLYAYAYTYVDMFIDTYMHKSIRTLHFLAEMRNLFPRENQEM